MPARLRIRDDEREWIAEPSGDVIALDDGGAALVVTDLGDGRFQVTSTNGDAAAAPIAGAAAAAGDSVWVDIDGEVFELRPARGGARAATREQDALTPPMPATVVRIAVAPGTAVRQGDVLIALEAMKMELSIKAPRDGVVSAVHCREGELVQPGQVLVEL